MFKLKKNIGSIDFFIRIIVGICFVYLGFINTQIIDDSVSSIILGIVGLVALSTATFRFCPLYRLVSFSTCKID
jgi:hypothetical protein